MGDDFISLTDFTKSRIYEIIDAAEGIKKENLKMENILKGKTILTIFPESSIRTRITFEAAIKQLGAVHLSLPPSSLEKKELLEDVAKYLECWVDMLVIRYPDLRTVTELAKHMSVPVINAMTQENHPCEIIADLQTLREQKGDLEKLKFAFVGAKGNISNTWFTAAGILDLSITQICPSGYEIDSSLYSYAKQNSKGEVRVTDDMEDGLTGADVILTDCWPAGIGISEKFLPYQISAKTMAAAGKDVLLNPCPPFTRGEEVMEDAIASGHFIGYKAKTNLLHAHKAIILSCSSII